MKTIRKATDLNKEIKKAIKCGDFVATPRGPGYGCIKNTGYCCNG